MSLTVDKMLQSMIDNMPEKTGKSLDEWIKVLGAAKLEKHGEMVKMLKGDHGVTHGFANTITSLYRQQAEGGPISEDELLAAQYAGAKADLKNIYAALIQAVTRFGADVEIAPKKTYVSLRRNKQFAIIKASTKTRVDLGLIMKGASPHKRLKPSKAFGEMCSHQVALVTIKDVDKTVIAWLKKAYQQS